MYVIQLDITDDGFLSLMSDDGTLKDDVKLPDGEVGEKIEKLFRTDEKETSMFFPVSLSLSSLSCILLQPLTTKTPDVVVLTAMGEEVAMDAKEAPRS